MKKWLIIFMLCTAGLFGREWVIPVKNLTMVSAPGLHSPEWFKERWGLKNFVNLSFFDKTFIPPYKDSVVENLHNKKNWPLLTITDGVIRIVPEGEAIPKADFISAGVPILVMGGKPSKLKRNGFTKRICWRTIVGVLKDGTQFVYIAHGTLFDLQQRLIRLGCSSAMNLDGGGSSFIFLNGKKEHSQREGRKFPNVLAWM